jgi:hypothetical protein
MDELTIEEEELVDFLKWLHNYEYSYDPSCFEEVVKDYLLYKKSKLEYLISKK